MSVNILQVHSLRNVFAVAAQFYVNWISRDRREGGRTENERKIREVQWMETEREKEWDIWCLNETGSRARGVHHNVTQQHQQPKEHQTVRKLGQTRSVCARNGPKMDRVCRIVLRMNRNSPVMDLNVPICTINILWKQFLSDSMATFCYWEINYHEFRWNVFPFLCVIAAYCVCIVLVWMSCDYWITWYDRLNNWSWPQLNMRWDQNEGKTVLANWMENK